MKPSDFEYARPASIQDAVALLASPTGDDKVLAGGQSLVPLMNFRLVAPTRLVDLGRIADLRSIEAGPEALRIGAMARTRMLETDPSVRASIPILAAAASWIGHIQIRNRGTVGGSIVHADPAAELPALCVLLDAELVAVSSRGTRTIAAADFFIGFLTTAIEPDEILTEVRFPIPGPGTRWGFREFAQRRGDFALAGAAVLIGPASGAVPTSARIAIFGTADRPIRAARAEAGLVGGPSTPALLDAVAALAGEDLAADDPRPDAAFRRRLTETLVRRALDDALDRDDADDGRPRGRSRTDA